MVARRADVAPLLLGRSSCSTVGVAVPHRHGGDPARDDKIRTADNLVAAVYVNAVGGQRRTGLTAVARRPCRPRGDEAPRLPATTAVTIDLIGCAACAAKTPPGARPHRVQRARRLPPARGRPAPPLTYDVKCPYLIHACEATASTAAAGPFLVPAHRSFFPFGDADPQPERTRFCEGSCSMRWRLRGRRLFRKTGRSARSASPCPGPRQPAVPAHRPPPPPAHHGEPPTGTAVAPHRRSFARSTCRRAIPLKRRATRRRSARELGVPFVAPRRRGLRSRGGSGVQRCFPARRRADRADVAEHPVRAARPAYGTGPTRWAGQFCRPAT